MTFRFLVTLAVVGSRKNQRSQNSLERRRDLRMGTGAGVTGLGPPAVSVNSETGEPAGRRWDGSAEGDVVGATVGV